MFKDSLLHVVLASVAIISSGVMAHYAEQDFQASEPVMRAMAKAMAEIPMTVGDWRGENQDMDSRTMNVAGVYGALTRLYKHPNGNQVSVYLACGSWRNMTQHTPERCYQAAGYEMDGFSMGANHSRVVTVKPLDEADGEGDSFVIGQFRKETQQGAQDIEVYWNWSPDGEHWQAPEGDPRVGLTSEPEWYKLYVISDYSRQESATNYNVIDRPIYQFCQDFMPIVKEKLAVVAEVRQADAAGKTK